MNKRLTTFFFLLWLYLFGVQLYYALHFFTDDAYISLRYAKHLSQGLGLVWNPGGKPLEGFTNFAWVGLEALLFYFNLNVILIIKSVSVMALLISTVLLYLISRFWLSRTLACLPSLLMLFHRGQILWTLSGLEMASYQCLILLSVYLFLYSVTNKQKRYLISSAVALVIASLIRFEAPILIPGFMLTLWWLDLNKGSARRFMWHFCYFLLPFLLFYVPYMIWRWQYFGRLFPNTVYCKAFMSVVPGFLDMDYLLMVCPLMLFSIPLFIDRLDRRFLILLLPSILYLIALIHGEVVVGYFHRLFLPVFVLLLPIFVKGIECLYALLCLNISSCRERYYTIGTVLLLGFFLIPSYVPPTNYQRFVSHQALNMSQRHQIALWLRDHVKEAEVVTVSDCGLIPFLYDGTVIDTYCLNNPDITQKPIDFSYARFINDVLNRQKPDYVILSAVTQQDKAYGSPFDEMIIKSSLFHQVYVKVKRFMVGDMLNGYFYDIYRRRTNHILKD